MSEERSRENRETLRRALDAFNRRDKAAWLAACNPDAENIPPSEWPENAPIRGAEAIWDFYVEAVKVWEEGAFEWGEMIDVRPDTIVANQRREMRGKASGAAVVWSYWVVFKFRARKIVFSAWFADRAEALEAAGLPE
jgi:ketosteroid isomerase-like protein